MTDGQSATSPNSDEVDIPGGAPAGAGLVRAVLRVSEPLARVSALCAVPIGVFMAVVLWVSRLGGGDMWGAFVVANYTSLLWAGPSSLVLFVAVTVSAIISAVTALRRIHRNRSVRGRTWAILGLVGGVVGIGLLLLALYFFVAVLIAG